MIFLLAIILLLILLIVYKYSKKELSAPSVIFIAPFFLMVLVACFNYAKWQLEDFHFITFVVVVIGVLFFFFGVVTQSKFIIKKGKKPDKLPIDINDCITKWHMIISLAIVLSSTLLYAYYLYSWGIVNGLSSFSQSIDVSMQNSKFSTGGASLDLPFFLNSLLICSKAIAYIYCTILAKNFIYKRKGKNVLLLLNIIIVAFSTLFGGSRGALIEYVVAFFAALLFYNYRKNGVKSINPKFIFGGAIAAVITVYFFFTIKGFIGREELEWGNIVDEICAYFGAQVENLDNVLGKGNIQHTKYFGYATLSSFYSIFNNYLGMNIRETVALPYHFVNGISLGNVLTCFYNYYVDFGVFGVAFYSYFSGIISQYFFRKAKGAYDQSIDVWLVIYIYLASHLFLCFFGNRFYTNLISAEAIRLYIWININVWFLRKFKFRNISRRRI